MIDQKMYREAFSRLRASEKAKEEVFQMAKMRQGRKLPGVLRAAAIAAVMAVVLAVSAGAVNMVTDGLLFPILWSDGNHIQLVDDAGNEVYVTVEDAEDALPGGAEVVKENGRLLLRAGDEETDITDKLELDGRYQYTYEEKETLPDGSQTTYAVTVYVTGDLENWTLTQSDGKVFRTATETAE